MFDSLRKRLKEAIDKVSKSVKEEPKKEEHKKVDERVLALEKIEAQEKEEEKIEEVAKRIEDKMIKQSFEENVIESPPEVLWTEKRIGIQEAVTSTEEEEKKKDKKMESLIEEIDEIFPEKPIKEPEYREDLKSEIIAEKKPEHEKEKKKPGFFARIFEKVITEEDVRTILKELQTALLENDVALEVAEKICSDVKAELVDKSVRRGKIEDAIKDALKKAMLDVMRQDKVDLEGMMQRAGGVFVVMFLGFNGTGKTTTVAKFATKFRKFHPVVAAGDTFRAASIEQLEEHSKSAGFRVVKHQYGADSAAVIFDAKKAALASGSKLVLADTAGRSHSNVNLMDELKKVVRVNSPDLKILILDSLTGNDIYDQCRLFNDAVGVDAIILTKADVYDRGGAALSAAYTIKKPILYLGVGQEYDDLKEFNPEEIAENLLK